MDRLLNRLWWRSPPPPPLLFGAAVLHWSLGLLAADEAGVATAAVRQRRLGLGAGAGSGSGRCRDCDRGVEGLEKNPNLEEILGLFPVLLPAPPLLLLSRGSLQENVLATEPAPAPGPAPAAAAASSSLGMEVQNARLQPRTIVFASLCLSWRVVGFVLLLDSRGSEHGGDGEEEGREEGRRSLQKIEKGLLLSLSPCQIYLKTPHSVSLSISKIGRAHV